jgi:hypothetical protein
MLHQRGLLSAVFVVVLGAGVVRGVDLTRWWLFTHRLEALMSAPAEGTPEMRTWKVGYGGSLFAVGIHVYPSEVEAGQALNTAWVFESADPVRRRYVRSLVGAQARTRLVEELAAQTRAISSRIGLSDDGYAELLARTVQDIPYGQMSAEISLPAEVLAGGAGVCTEKSVLLAALLVHEGYDTAVLVLDSHNHVAVGVRSDGLRFRSLPYAFVETTRSEPIGSYSADLLGWGPVYRPPQTIPVGGTKRYGSGRSRAQTSVM